MVTPAEAQTYAFAYPWILTTAGMMVEIIGRTPPQPESATVCTGSGSASRQVSPSAQSKVGHHTKILHKFNASVHSCESLTSEGLKGRSVLIRAADGEHVEGDGCRPGLLTGAERLAGERLEVLGEAAFRELFQGLAAHTLGPRALPRAQKRPPEEPVGDGPNRTAPVAARVEPGLFGARRWGQRIAKVGVTGKILRVERPEEVVQPLAIEAAPDQGRETGYGSHGQRFASQHVQVQTEPEVGVPLLFEAGTTAFDPTLYKLSVLLGRVDDLGDFQQRLVGRNQDGGEEHVFDEEGVPLVDVGLVVAGPLEELQQPQEAVVLAVGRTVRGVGDVLEVIARIRRHLPDGDPLQYRIPARGVVRAALPGMVDGHQPRTLGVAGRRQVAVPGEQPAVVAFQESAGAGDTFLVLAPGRLPDTPHGNGMDGRLAQAAGALALGRVLGERGGVPALRVGKVAPGWRVGVEHYVWHLARRPLAAKQAIQLVRGATVVYVRQAERDERRVPAPLVRVKGGRRLGPGLQPVAA